VNPSWSPQQREWLEALGHEVLVLAGAELPAEEPPTWPAETPLPVARATRAPDVSPSGESPMLRALLRAAGRRDRGELPWLPDPATLRGDAAAKRALWPRLRALRRKPGGA